MIIERTTLERSTQADTDIHDLTGEVEAFVRETGVEEGSVLSAISEYADLTAHYQIASPPDRGEPDHGTLDYAEVFQLIDATGYGGWVGCEYRPRNGTMHGLSWVAELGVRLGDESGVL